MVFIRHVGSLFAILFSVMFRIYIIFMYLSVCLCVSEESEEKTDFHIFLIEKLLYGILFIDHKETQWFVLNT